MKDKTEIRDGWVWPTDDISCWNYMISHPNLPQLISSHVNNRQVCVQAGGNMGYYVKQYANLFDNVYTFEPEPINFFCLNQNVQEENVFKYQACIGYDRNLVNLKIKVLNRGKNHVNGIGKIPTLRIDDLNLTVCNLIHLDIEGFEFFALKGAVNTISRCNPVVVLEFFNKCATRYDYTLDDVENLMLSLGYILLTTYEEERVYIPKKNI